MIEGWECWGCIWDYMNPFSVGFALILFGGGLFILGYIFGRRTDGTDERP